MTLHYLLGKMATEDRSQFGSTQRGRPVQSPGWRCAALVGLYLLFAGLIILRRPDCLTNAQFWAEDGKRFFANAVERPFWLNLGTYSYGYFDFLLRLMHELAALFPLRLAPRVLAICAIVIQAAVPTYVVSRRSEDWLGAFPVRFFAAVLYCLLPNSFEAHAIGLHSRVHFAVLAGLIIVGRPAITLAGKVFDHGVLVLSSLSGPFFCVLVPAALWRYAARRTPALRRNVIILLGASVPGLFALLTSTSGRFVGQMGASVQNFVRIIGGQFTTSFFLGEETYRALLNQPWFDATAWAGFVFLALLLLVILYYSSTEIRCLLLIGFGLLAMALVTPLAGFDRSHWDALWTVPGCGQRYYVPGMGMLLFSIAALVGRGEKRWRRGLGVGCLVLIASMGVRVDFVLPPFADYHFARYAKRYKKLPPGQSIAIPINPPTWVMELRKPAK